MNPDERIVVGHDIMASPPEAFIKLIYPELYPLHDIGELCVHVKHMLCMHA